MRILFLSQVLPHPLDAGPKLRAYYVLRHLAAQHEVTLLSFVRPSDPAESLEHLRSICARVVTVPMQRSRRGDVLAFGQSLLSGRPFMIARDKSMQMEERLQDLMQSEPFDAVHADQLWMAPYGLQALAASEVSNQALHTVLDQHNAVHKIPERMARGAFNPFVRLLLRREARLMKAYEQSVCEQFDDVVWVTAEDLRAVLGGVNGRSAAADMVIPICLDPTIDQPALELADSAKLLFLGGMHWPPNAEGVNWFVKQVLPRIRGEAPEVSFTAVGKAPPPEIQQVEAVVAPGYVSDTQPYWAQSRVFVVPLMSGGGMRVKILDAWARGIPVVSTSIGAEGLAYRDGDNLLVADSPEDFAEAVHRIVRDDQLARRLSRAGRETVEQSYDWRLVYPAWDQIYSGR